MFRCKCRPNAKHARLRYTHVVHARSSDEVRTDSVPRDPPPPELECWPIARELGLGHMRRGAVLARLRRSPSGTDRSVPPRDLTRTHGGSHGPARGTLGMVQPTWDSRMLLRRLCQAWVCRRAHSGSVFPSTLQTPRADCALCAYP